MKKYEVVVGIDFGSSGSGFAYSFYNKDSIIIGQMSSSSNSNKVPTEIILDNNNEVVQFGSECVKYIKESGLNDCYYFKGIKMELYENKKTIKARNTNEEFPLKLIIRKCLEKIKEIAIKQISNNRPELLNHTEKIKWVVTIPSILEEAQKNIMMDSCIEAGLVSEDTDKSLFFALEPEAASLYCSINKEIDRNSFNEGEYYIVCDLGGGTGDIVAHLVGSNNVLNEIYPSFGGKYGSNEIDNFIFKDIIFKLFGCNDFNTFFFKYMERNKGNEEENDKQYFYNYWLDIENKIKDFKESILSEKISNNIKYPIDVSLFQYIFDEGTDINNLVNNYNNTIQDKLLKLSVRKDKKYWIIEFPYEIIYKYILIQANSICQKINKINSEEEIKSIIFVGGYCSNKVLLNLIKSIGLEKIEKYLIPSNPSLAIMEGAVLFGIEPSKIENRKSKYTLGIKVNKKWNDSKCPRKDLKYFNKKLNDWHCKNCFEKFIEINQNIKYKDEIAVNNLFSEGYIPKIFIYKTEKKNPLFIDEEGVIKIGECKLEINEEYNNIDDREITIIIKFGGTFIDINAIHIKSGKNEKTTLIFY